MGNNGFKGVREVALKKSGHEICPDRIAIPMHFFSYFFVLLSKSWATI